MIRIYFQLVTQRATSNSDNRSSPVSRGVFARRRMTINCWRNRAFSASSSARLRRDPTLGHVFQPGEPIVRVEIVVTGQKPPELDAVENLQPAVAALKPGF